MVVLLLVESGLKINKCFNCCVFFALWFRFFYVNFYFCCRLSCFSSKTLSITNDSLILHNELIHESSIIYHVSSVVFVFFFFLQAPVLVVLRLHKLQSLLHKFIEHQSFLVFLLCHVDQ